MPLLPAPPCSQAPLGASCCCCKRCNLGGCDLRVVDCGCCFHARCCPVSKLSTLSHCPICGKVATALRVMPMAFDELDTAQREAACTALTDKRGKKRKNATIARLNTVVVDDASPESAAGLRSGRWTDEETDYCDKLIELFEQGQLPMLDGIKLNDFLSNMLKSKQSRLTKKMKNARLSARQYKCELGYIENDEVAIAFSRSETEFFASIKCSMERSEIRFHMQREWRELFSSYCASVGQKLDAHDWMSSVEELDRRVSLQLDAARMARRKTMMGLALEKDFQMNAVGVFIDPEVSSSLPLGSPHERQRNHRRSASMESLDSSKTSVLNQEAKPDIVRYFSSPLVKKILQYAQRHQVPFEHVDVWVPSMTVGVDNERIAAGVNGSIEQQQKCRLFFAGFGTTHSLVPVDGGPPELLSSDQVFDYLSFGAYSEKFSFEVGCGLPGRVYASGVSSWEHGIQNAPQSKFERRGGAEQWGIQTALGIPVPSPNVGRVVFVFYSKFDRIQNLGLVDQLCTELSKLVPTPRWNLVVDVGPMVLTATAENQEDVQRQAELLNLVEAYIPKNKDSPLAFFLPGFTSLRLLLMKQTKSEKESELMQTVISSYTSYKQAGRSDPDVAAMTARDYMLLTRQGQQEPSILNNYAVATDTSRQVVQPCATIFNPLPVSNTGQPQFFSSEVVDCGGPPDSSRFSVSYGKNNGFSSNGDVVSSPLPAIGDGHSNNFLNVPPPCDQLTPHRVFDNFSEYFP